MQEEVQPVKTPLLYHIGETDDLGTRVVSSGFLTWDEARSQLATLPARRVAWIDSGPACQPLVDFLSAAIRLQGAMQWLLDDMDDNNETLSKTGKMPDSIASARRALRAIGGSTSDHPPYAQLEAEALSGLDSSDLPDPLPKFQRSNCEFGRKLAAWLGIDKSTTFSNKAGVKTISNERLAEMIKSGLDIRSLVDSPCEEFRQRHGELAMAAMERAMDSSDVVTEEKESRVEEKTESSIETPESCFKPAEPASQTVRVRELETHQAEAAINLASARFPRTIYRTDCGRYAVSLEKASSRGLSLFALDFIPRHTLLWRSPTIVLPREVLTESPELNLYAFGISDGFDSSLSKEWFRCHHAEQQRPFALVCGLPQLMNGGKKGESNVAFNSSHLRLIDFVSTQDIKEGEELLLDYGYFRSHWTEAPTETTRASMKG